MNILELILCKHYYTIRSFELFQAQNIILQALKDIVFSIHTRRKAQLWINFKVQSVSMIRDVMVYFNFTVAFLIPDTSFLSINFNVRQRKFAAFVIPDRNFSYISSIQTGFSSKSNKSLEPSQVDCIYIHNMCYSNVRCDGRLKWWNMRHHTCSLGTILSGGITGLLAYANVLCKCIFVFLAVF